MSGTSVVTMVDGGGGGGGCYYRPPPFTAVQWQELEHQAMIYKYLKAGVPIPSELLVSIRRSFDSISSRFFNTSLGYSSYYGKKFDPEPGRCKRTDGKKWRCAKDAHPDSKYCERHMHRGKGRNRSRKPVESPSSVSSQHHVDVATLHNATGGNNRSTVAAAVAASSGGILQNSGGNGVYQNIPFYSISNSDGLYSGRNVAKFQIDFGSSQNDNKEYRYVHGVHTTTDGDSGNLSLEASGSIGNIGMGQQSSEHHHMDHHHHHAYDSMDEITMLKLEQHHQKLHSFGEIENVKQEQQHDRHHHHSMQPFFDEWPTTKESWSNLGENGTWKNANSKTMLSMSIPLDYSEFSASNAHSPDDV